MTSRIAVTVDGTSECESALQRAVDMARLQGAALTGVFVVDSAWADFIGNDWQSSRNARQGFLDYMREEQLRQAAMAEEQFRAATSDIANAQFTLLEGDPADALVRMMDSSDVDVLVAGKTVFRACGRPSAKALPGILSRKVRQPLLLV